MKRSAFSLANLRLLDADPSLEGMNEADFRGTMLMRPDEDDIDFMSDVYDLVSASPADLRNSWRVFTADTSIGSHRLENAAWRLQGMRKANSHSELAKLALGPPLAETLAAQQSNSGGKGPPRPLGRQRSMSLSNLLGKQDADTGGPPTTDKAGVSLTAKRLAGLAVAQGWSDGALDSLLRILKDPIFDSRDVPPTAAKLRAVPAPEVRPTVALFTHSLQRNGANNFSLFLVRGLLETQKFVVFAPKEGPMRQDFEDTGLEVNVVDTKSPSFLQTLTTMFTARNIGFLVANTIMRCDVVSMARRAGLPTVWVIHESWPKDKLEYYAQEVFLRKELTAAKIKHAFRSASCIVFPSNMQAGIYKGLYSSGAAKTIYNGIPLRRLDEYRRNLDRATVRRALGYKPNEVLVLHIGTICGRKGQVYTAKACTGIIQQRRAAAAAAAAASSSPVKVLMVGARYIRDHEIAYIDKIKAAIVGGGCTWTRWEETADEDRGKSDFTIMDIQKNVLRFYAAADIVVVPSLNEVLPLVIGEAMAFERPVVCSAIDAIPEAVTDGVEGLLIPPANPKALQAAVGKLISDPGLRMRMGRNGRARVERQFAYPGMCVNYRRVMDAVAAQARRSSPASLPPPVPRTATPERSRTLTGRGAGAVLVDLDNTVVDWDAEFISRYARASGAAAETVTTKVRGRKHYEIELNFEPADRARVLGVVAEKGFYAALRPLEGAIEALKEMVAMGIDVRIVTSPHPTCPASCAAEKYEWLLAHLGQEWVDRMIIARDKTHVAGTLLVDDKPKITGGNAKPSWTHVVFDQPYNRDGGGRPRLASWPDWKKVLSSARRA